MSHKFFGDKLLFSFFLLLNCFLSNAFAVDISTSTSTSATTTLISPDLGVNISSGGNLIFSNSSGVTAPAISGTGDSFAVTVSANLGEGISATRNPGGGEAQAILVNSGLLTVNLNSGVITSDTTRGTIELSNQVVGTDTINIAAGASLLNTNTTNANSWAIRSLNTNSGTFNFNVNNAGTIQSQSATSARGIFFTINDSANSSFLNIANSGTIDAGIGRAINPVANAGTIDVTINNSGTIIGGSGAIGGAIFSNTSGVKTNITNSGTITGNITLGTSAASTLDITGGSVTSNLTFNDSAQTVTISGGNLSGTLNGSGIVNIGSAGTLKINSVSGTIATSDFIAVINGSSAGVGSLEINAAQDVTTGGNIGETRALAQAVIGNNATLRLGNNLLFANTVKMQSGSTFIWEIQQFLVTLFLIVVVLTAMFIYKKMQLCREAWALTPHR